MTIQEKLTAFRARMGEKGFKTVIVPTADSHASEYIPDHFKTRVWLSGFTGSAGTLVVDRDEAALFVDGRYYLQAEHQTEGTGIRVMRMGTAGTPTLEQYVSGLLGEGDCLGADFSVISVRFAEEMQKTAARCGAGFRDSGDLCDGIWKDRPALPDGRAFLLDEKWAGRTAEQKLSDIRERMRAASAQIHVTNVLDEIAWTLNVRGGDVQYNPVVMGYLAVGETDCRWFVDERKLNAGIMDAMSAAGVAVCPYDAVCGMLPEITRGKTVLIDGGKLTAALKSAMPEAAFIQADNPAFLMKAIKNETELDNLRAIHIKDGAAVTRLMYWLKTNAGKIPMTEISVSNRLESLRREIDGYIELSFSTICAYREHAAMMHYSATPETDAVIDAKDFLLIDSGGHYLEGTTDITRTFAMGPIEDEQKRHFTAVLCSMIDLADAKFLYGCTGVNLDILARRPIWELGLDYRCGTGHGVSYIGGVHEGPNGFRWKVLPPRTESAVLEAGMVTTDEPGVYIEGSHGIRTENELICVRLEETEYGQFMGFETITCCPIDPDAVIPELMTSRQRAWLNRYHTFVREKLMPLMPTAAEREWLAQVTREI